MSAQEATIDQAEGSGPQAAAQEQHRWLLRMVGDWTVETEATMAPGQPPVRMTGTQRMWSIGELWLVGQGEGDPGPGAGTTLITLGYDTAKQRFVGSFVASMMTNQWLYDGALDGDVLTLDSEGPAMTAEGTAKYQDVVERVDDDHWILRSRTPGEGGGWVEFMTAHYRRKR